MTDQHRRLILDQFTKQAVPFAQMQHSPELLLAASEVEPADNVLDVACGPGLMACAFAKVARRVCGIDLTPAMIEQAKILQQSHGLTNLDWQLGDVLPLPFPDAAFSLVFTRYSFHHFLDPRAVLAEMVRVCLPGGRVMVVDVYTSSQQQAEAYNLLEKLRDPSHVRALAAAELTEWFHEAGLQDVKTQYFRHEFGVEEILERSFPNPGDADRIRQMVADDLGVDRLGIGVYHKEGKLRFAFPVVIVVGHRSEMNDLTNTWLIRDCRQEEAEAVLALWRRADATPSATDSVEEIRRVIADIPAHVLVAEVGGQIVGSIIGSFDGWRGNIYRLVVHPHFRRKGLARALVAEVENRLRRQGAKRITALVEKDHAWATAFWEAVGYGWDQRMVRHAKNL